MPTCQQNPGFRGVLKTRPPMEALSPFNRFIDIASTFFGYALGDALQNREDSDDGALHVQRLLT